MLGDTAPKRTRLVVDFVALLGAIAIILSGVALAGRLHDATARHLDQARFNRSISQVSLRDCQEIEKLKKAQRDAAILNFKNLDKNAALLGIRVTPQLREAAKEGRDATLRRFAPGPCPRK